MFSKKTIRKLAADRDLHNPTIVGHDRHGCIVEATGSEGYPMRCSLKKRGRLTAKAIQWFMYTGNERTWHRGY